MGICAKREGEEGFLMLGGVLAFKQFELQPYELKTEIGLFFLAACPSMSRQRPKFLFL